MTLMPRSWIVAILLKLFSYVIEETHCACCEVHVCRFPKMFNFQRFNTQFTMITQGGTTKLHWDEWHIMFCVYWNFEMRVDPLRDVVFVYPIADVHIQYPLAYSLKYYM